MDEDLQGFDHLWNIKENSMPDELTEELFAENIPTQPSPVQNDNPTWKALCTRLRRGFIVSRQSSGMLTGGINPKYLQDAYEAAEIVDQLS